MKKLFIALTFSLLGSNLGFHKRSGALASTGYVGRRRTQGHWRTVMSRSDAIVHRRRMGNMPFSHLRLRRTL